MLSSEVQQEEKSKDNTGNFVYNVITTKHHTEVPYVVLHTFYTITLEERNCLQAELEKGSGVNAIARKLRNWLTRWDMILSGSAEGRYDNHLKYGGYRRMYKRELGLIPLPVRVSTAEILSHSKTASETSSG